MLFGCSSLVEVPIGMLMNRRWSWVNRPQRFFGLAPIAACVM